METSRKPACHRYLTYSRQRSVGYKGFLLYYFLCVVVVLLCQNFKPWFSVSKAQQ